MHLRALPATITFLALSLSFSPPARPAEPISLADRLAGARPGSTITLPAGVFAGGIQLPPGVSLRGAGYNQTILDASQSDVGLTVACGKEITLSDLAIRGARQTDLLIKDAERVSVRRVRTTGSITGLVLAGVRQGRIENTLSDANRYGIVISGGDRCEVVNCTLADNSSLGLSFPSGRRTVAFNNCIAHSATGVYVGIAARDLHLDHNLYAALYPGKLEGQVGRKTMGEWTAVSGHDAHSVSLPVIFRAPRKGDYRAANALDWALDRPVTAGWARAELAGVKAPQRDMDDRPRPALPCLGAHEVQVIAPRPADGTFTVKSGAGITSAGVFTKAGREVAYLFHNLPLAAGEQRFWLPSRDFQGRTIRAGDYEVRTVESALDWHYLGRVGNNGAETPVGASAAANTARVAFDRHGQLITACDGWAENFVNMRAYDAADGTWHWAFHAPADVKGLAITADGILYALRLTGKQERLTRVDARTGKVKPWPRLDTGELTLKTGAQATGLAELDGRLYFTDTAAGKIYRSPAEAPAFTPWAEVRGAASPSADHKHRLLWVIAGGKKLTALSPEGKVVAEAAPVEAPAALAARDGRLAVASFATGKVHLFDSSNPRALRPVGTVGTGDGPFGPFAPDRFGFQRSGRHAVYPPAIDLGPNQELAVGYRGCVAAFDAAGKSLWYTFGVAGGGCVANHSNPQRLFEMDGSVSFRMDEKKGRWQPDGFWQQPALPQGSVYLGDFSLAGKAFGVYTTANPTHGPAQGLLFVRLKDYRQIPVLAISHDARQKAYFSRKDTNHDGTIDEADAGELFSREGDLFYFMNLVQANGDIITTHQWSSGRGIQVLPCAGLDADGAPLYRPAARRVVAQAKDQPFLSPHTFQPEPDVGVAGATPAPEGGFTVLLNVRSSPGGTGMLNGAGNEPASIDATGRVRWIHPLSRYQGVYNLCTVGDISVTGSGSTATLVVLDRDGLGLGTFGQPASAHYNGYWLDHPQAVHAWKGADGAMYVMIADNFNGCDRWWRLDPRSPLSRSTFPLTLAPRAAEVLAALPRPDMLRAAERPATATVRIPRLRAPLPIDGDLKKWRAAGITPNVIITPETAVTGIKGPRDASAVIRVAYHGTDLYVQVLRFDDLVTFHQPVERHYMQDCVEMCLNGFGPGFKFDITRTTDLGDLLIRQRFFFNKLDRPLSPAHAPRVIKVLDNARNVPERELIESVYGEDLSACRVIVSELKLPIDKETYQGATDALFPVAPGKTFWLGFMLDDNDEPGTDVQRLLVWPATYGTFNPPEDGALATFGD